MSFERIFGAGAILLVAIGVVLAFRTIGTPAHARQLQFDERRSMELHRLAWAISERYGGNHEPLPTALPPNPQAMWNASAFARDPETNALYGYERTGPETFRLCATFALPAEVKDAQIEDTHGAGRTCFRYDARAMAGR